MTKKQKKVLYRIIIAAVLLAAFMLAPIEEKRIRFVLFLIPYAVIGYDILRKAVLGIVHGEVFDFRMKNRTATDP